MHDQDVLDIVQHEAAVKLGATELSEMWLFYSPPDQGYKIAIVSPNRSILMSVWQANYVLPSGMDTPTPGRKFQAKKLLEQFLFDRAAGRLQKPQLLARINLKARFGSLPALEQELGKIHVGTVPSLEYICQCFKDELARILLELPTQSNSQPLFIALEAHSSSQNVRYEVREDTLRKKLQGFGIDFVALIARARSEGEMVRIMLEVMQGGRTEYRHELGSLPYDAPWPLRKLVAHFSTQIAAVLDAVEEIMETPSTVKYRFHFEIGIRAHHSEGKPHTAIRRMLSAAS